MTDEIQTRGAPDTELDLIRRLRDWPATAPRKDAFSSTFVGELLSEAADEIAHLRKRLAKPVDAQSPYLRGEAPFCKLRGFRGSKLCVDGCEQAGKCLRDPAMTSPSQPTSPSVDGETLRPCPFCGSEEVRCCHGLGGTKVVECQSCETTGPRVYDEFNAKAQWNYRAALSRSEAPVAGDYEHGKLYVYDAASQTFDTYAAPPPDVSVRALEWEESKGQIDGQVVWSSGDPWLFWVVKNPSDPKYVWCENFNIEGFFPCSPVRGSFDKLEDAKAAAQDDYTKRILAALAALPQPGAVEPNPLADLVSRFADALLKKLRLAQANGRGGWDRDDWEKQCQEGLLHHVNKGDPRDVAAYCAFMWHHGWVTKPPALDPAQSPVFEALKLAHKALTPFALSPGAISLSSALGHIERQHLLDAVQAIEAIQATLSASNADTSTDRASLEDTAQRLVDELLAQHIPRDKFSIGIGSEELHAYVQLRSVKCRADKIGGWPVVWHFNVGPIVAGAVSQTSTTSGEGQ